MRERLTGDNVVFVVKRRIGSIGKIQRDLPCPGLPTATHGNLTPAIDDCVRIGTIGLGSRVEIVGDLVVYGITERDGDGNRNLEDRPSLAGLLAASFSFFCAKPGLAKHKERLSLKEFRFRSQTKPGLHPPSFYTERFTSPQVREYLQKNALRLFALVKPNARAHYPLRTLTSDGPRKCIFPSYQPKEV